MSHTKDLNAFLSQNPGDAYHASFNTAQVDQMDPLLQAGADAGTTAPAPAYSGLTGDPFHTAVVTDAQLKALRPKRPRPTPLPPPQPFAGLSSYLGA